MDIKWIQPNMDLFHIDENHGFVIDVMNSGNLEIDFYKYAQNFYNAAETVIHYLTGEVAANCDIAKLDLWYFATVYLYRQSLELLLKASIFQTITDKCDRKNLVGKIRHDLKQSFEKLIEIKGLELDKNENAKWVMDFLSDISCIDRASDMFRYPFGNNFKALFNRQTHISLQSTHDNMNKAYTVIKAIYATGVFPIENYEADVPQLIIEGGDYYQQSVVGYKYSQNSFYPYFSSYTEVGDFLNGKTIEQNQSGLFMPMCYLYRNAVELGLKRLIFEDSHMDACQAAIISRKKKHSILGLWNSIVDEIGKYANVPDGDTTLDNAERYIRAFHNFDLGSDLFRYPCSKNMDSYFLNLKKFDIENVASCFEELCNFLDGVDSMLSAVKEYEAEQSAEMASYYSY